jgi:hypothetical protein
MQNIGLGMRTAAADACDKQISLKEVPTIHVFNPKKVYWDTEGISGQNEMGDTSHFTGGK